ncbi:MAG: fluoride efflux transporter CrcB [Methylococcales bacterium]|nr:MAG: fluoride efflux transporter CrcB [Methylococcales bacterium]
MNQLISIALGGACGAVVRFLMSSGLYQWLGRGFPYGTLAVNLVGSFLIGLLTEALILQRIAIGVEYRAAILVGFIGAFTTFSTFSLETIYLLEQGSFGKAGLNILVSVLGCLLAVWIGLLLGRSLFLYSGGVFHWNGGVVPYALLIVNGIGAFLIGIIVTVLMQKVALSMEYRATIMIIMVGTYLTLSGLYLVLFLLEREYTFESNVSLMLGTFVGNGLSCLLVIWIGLLVGRQI